MRDRPALYTEPYQGTMPADDSNPSKGQDSNGTERRTYRDDIVETWTPVVEVPERVVEDARRRVERVRAERPEYVDDREYSLLMEYLVSDHMDSLEFVDEDGERLEESDE